MINPKWREWHWNHSYNCENCSRRAKGLISDMKLLLSAPILVAMLGVSIEILFGKIQAILTVFLLGYAIGYLLFLVFYVIASFLMGEDPHWKTVPKFWIKKSEFLTLNPKVVERRS